MAAAALPASFYGGFAAAGYPHSITEVRPALAEPYQLPLETVSPTAVPVAQTDSLPYSFAGGMHVEQRRHSMRLWIALSVAVAIVLMKRCFVHYERGCGERVRHVCWASYYAFSPLRELNKDSSVPSEEKRSHLCEPSCITQRPPDRLSVYMDSKQRLIKQQQRAWPSTSFATGTLSRRNAFYAVSCAWLKRRSRQQ